MMNMWCAQTNKPNTAIATELNATAETVLSQSERLRHALDGFVIGTILEAAPRAHALSA